MRNKKKFNEFMNKTIEELKDEKRYGTAHVYQSTLNAFCEFCGCKIVYFHQLNRATLKEFETHLRDKQLSWTPFPPICGHCAAPTTKRWTRK